jgi:hypothetical protein
MSETKAFVALTVIAAVGVLGTTSAAWPSFFGDRHHRGGFVIPCSLDGVNPVYRPEIFGDPAAAYRDYGFVRSRDGTWHVEKSCVRGLYHN